MLNSMSDSSHLQNISNGLLLAWGTCRDSITLTGILLRKKKDNVWHFLCFFRFCFCQLHTSSTDVNEAWTWKRSSRSSAASIVSSRGKGDLQTPKRSFQCRRGGGGVVRAVIGLFNRSWTDSGGGELTLHQHWFAQAGSGIPEFCPHDSAPSKFFCRIAFLAVSLYLLMVWRSCSCMGMCRHL